MEDNPRVTGLESINAPNEYECKSLIGQDDIILGDFSSYIIPKYLIHLADPKTWIYAELDGVEKRVKLYEKAGILYIIDLLNGKKYEIN